MPTPVSAARQCLTQESATVLDEAVAVARRRGHAQTTSLHMVSSLLSLPNSSLREACTRTRNSAYSTRVQFKALELSLSVSLDRLPSSQASKVEEPPVSNSLMAAIKRSQANQRRQPENFTFYQQQQQQQYTSCSSIPVVKVELQNLVVSILDDPLVSRVLGEAGFRSCDIKMATIRPGNSFYPSHLFGCTSRYKRPKPPMFLCSNDGSSEVGGKGFSFPFMGCYSGDENCRRISEVVLRGKKRSPLLMGISAGDALRNFLETVQRKIKGVLPEGLSVVCIKDEIRRYLSGDCDDGPLKLRFEEVERMVEEAGILVNFGDLNTFVADGVGIDGLRFLVSKLGGLIEVFGGKLRLIGAASTYEVYFKILNKFPTIEEDWGLEVLPITSSIKFSVGGSYPRSSLMESFVPLGGFFSVPPETVTPSSNARQYAVRCHLCNEKYEQEVAALSNGDLPSVLQSAGSQNGSSSIKGKDDRLLLNAKIMALQKKWDGICEQHHHLNRTFSKGYNHPRVLGFQVDEGKREKTSSDDSSNEQGNKNASSTLSTDLQRSSSIKELSSLDMLSKANKNLSIISNSVEELKGDTCVLKAQHFDSLSEDNSRTSPTSVTSVTTDLGLGIVSASTRREPVDQSRLNTFTPCISKCTSQSSLSIYQMHPDVKDLKLLYKALIDRVDHQQSEAISSIIEALSHCQTRQRNTWMIFRGGDRLSKKKVGLALAETLYGSTENFVYMDLSFQDDNTHIDSLFNSQVVNKYDITMRGTVVDYLVEKLSKKPRVVFFENIDKADLVVQNTLSEAAKSCRFTDLSGREVSVSNCIFLGATKPSESSQSEEDVVSTKGSLIQILIRFDLNDESDVLMMNKRNRDRSIDQEVNKRAYKKSNSYLDLNLPAEGSEICNTTESDTDSNSENSRSWFEDFERQVDQTVVFKDFDFETFGEKLIKNVSDCLHDAVGSKCSIEIEPKVLQQLQAAAYLYGIKKVEDWIQNVLRKGFLEAMGKFSINVRSVIKLVTCEEQHEGLLPARITIK
ncbi:hypothetical protein ACS0TY_000992 [Phlomoides rotata]